VTPGWRALPLALLLLGGCGMYGPLYLEEPEPPAAATPPPAAVEPDEDEDEDDAAGAP
jgi:predicted small lipoprotein YifL